MPEAINEKFYNICQNQILCSCYLDGLHYYFIILYNLLIIDMFKKPQYYTKQAQLNYKIHWAFLRKKKWLLVYFFHT